MPYPFWETAVGYGPLMAVIAVLHVFVSHFAIGGGLYLVVAERGARKRGDTQHLAFLERLSRFFVLLSLVFGALSGVAIWFVIGLLSPAGTETLIHAFVWGWAIEWTFFIVEVLAAMLYYYGWKRLSPRDHMAIGWIYFAAAWLSLVVINGIVTFMLTPGAWLETHDVWDGFFNPTYIHSLVLRTGICILLAGLFALFVATRHPDRDARLRIVRGAASWGLVGLVLSVAGFLFYAQAGALQEPAFLGVARRLALPATAMRWMLGAGIVLALGLVLTWARPGIQRRPLALVLLLAGLVGFGGFEWWREGLRKPYVIHGYMWGNGFLLEPPAAQAGRPLLERLAFRTGDDGRDLFNYSCRSCHQLEGYRGIKQAFDGTDATFIEGMLGGLHVMRAPMPPFAGNAEERATLAAWLAQRVDRRPLSEIHDLAGAALGRKVFEVRCMPCHVPGGHGDVMDTLTTLEAQDLDDLLSDTEMAPEMPRFTGDDAERAAFIEYVLRRKEPTK